jgi:tetratricopeptide (TPR) repeat protein
VVKQNEMKSYGILFVALQAVFSCAAQKSSFEDLFKEAFECHFCPDSLQIALYTKAIESGVDDTADLENFRNAVGNRAKLYERTGQYKEAIEDFELALALGPEDYQLYSGLATAYLRDGQYREAIEEYDVYIRIAEKEMKEALSVYQTDISAKRPVEMLSEMAESVRSEFNAKLANAYNNRGIAKGNLRRHEAACADFRKAYEAGMNKLKSFIDSECPDADKD